MRGNNAVKFFAVVAVIAILTYLALAPNGTFIPGLNVTIPSAYDIRQAADLKGGVDATLVAKDGQMHSEKDLNAAKSVIEHRLDSRQVMDRSVTVDKTKGRINVEIPLKKGATLANPGETLKDLGNTAELEFYEVSDNTSVTNAAYGAGSTLVKVGNAIITGKNVHDAYVETENGQPVVSLELDSDGTTKFAEATQRLLNKRIGIYLDKDLIEAPRVDAVITNGKAIINGQKDAAEASNLASTIKSGSLPFTMETKYYSTVSPALGSNALSVGVLAGIVAFGLICLFMLLFYRLPGLLACIALLGHTMIQLLFISWSGLTMSLPGLAAIILSIGMGVDANVIIFERVKEELRNGKTLRSAIDVGFKRAFSAVLDGNITTLISGVVLYYFGTGQVKSFAMTLMLGVALSFLTAVTASRIMLKAVSGLNIAKHPVLYGVKGGKKQNG